MQNLPSRALPINIKSVKLNHTAPPVLAFVDQECWEGTVPQQHPHSRLSCSTSGTQQHNLCIQGTQLAAPASISPTNKEGKVCSMTRKAMRGKQQFKKENTPGGITRGPAHNWQTPTYLQIHLNPQARDTQDISTVRCTLKENTHQLH